MEQEAVWRIKIEMQFRMQLTLMSNTHAYARK